MTDISHRHWQVLRHIPRFPTKKTAKDVRKALQKDGYNVSERTVQRDLKSLARAFPIGSDEKERPYGWYWLAKSAPLNVPALSSTEALNFLMVRQFLTPLMPASVLKQLNTHFHMAEQALKSLDSNAPARGWQKKVAMVPPWQPLLPAKINQGIQDTVQEALLQGRQLKLRYQRRGEETDVEYVAHPLGLVQRGGVIYLVASLFDYSDVRLLAMHRVRRAEMLYLSSRRPAGFDLSRYVAEGNLDFGSGQTIDLVLRFSRAAGEHLWDTPLSANQQITELDDGRLEVRAKVADSPQLCWWLLGFAEGVEVVGPTALRDELAARLRTAVAIYGP